MCVSGPQSSSGGSTLTSNEARLCSLVEEYEVLVSDLLAILAYLIGEFGHASTLFTAHPSGTA